MPIVIGLILAALITFYFKGRPSSEVESSIAAVQTDNAVAPPTEPESMSSTVYNDGDPPLLIARPIEPSIMLDATPDGPTLIATSATESEFTPWLSPLALDTYIRQLNQGFGQTFWQRGYWITAVEGRWYNGAHEFRIIFKASPDHAHWQYRANQTLTAFKSSNDDLQKEGYSMAQSQAYTRPDGMLRYQGVWHRQPDTATIADLPGVPPQNSSEPDALDVNQLTFR